MYIVTSSIFQSSSLPHPESDYMCPSMSRITNERHAQPYLKAKICLTLRLLHRTGTI